MDVELNTKVNFELLIRRLPDKFADISDHYEYISNLFITYEDYNYFDIIMIENDYALSFIKKLSEKKYHILKVGSYQTKTGRGINMGLRLLSTKIVNKLPFRSSRYGYLSFKFYDFPAKKFVKDKFFLNFYFSKLTISSVDNGDGYITTTDDGLNYRSMKKNEVG